VTLRKVRISVGDIRRTIDAWRALLPLQAADDSDLLEALEAVRAYQMAFWDAMLWASARRAGVRHLVAEDLRDRFTLQGVTFIVSTMMGCRLTCNATRRGSFSDPQRAAARFCLGMQRLSQNHLLI
jgi:predicted nucleic acid-binding protein